MFRLLALALPLGIESRLRGFQANEAAVKELEGLDEVALLQRELTPAQGMHVKSTDEWLEHISDHHSKIGAEQRVLDNSTVAGQLSKINSPGGCVDDLMWRDADGDGCEIYRFAIEIGRTTREAACGGGGEVQAPGLRGAPTRVVADATAKVFCPVTCGMCKSEQPAPESLVSVGPPSDSLDDVTFLQVGVSASAGPAKKSVETWAEHAYDHASRITADQRVLHNETVSHQLSALQRGEGCFDDPKWRDADGDGCEIYKFAIESGKTTREVACGGGGEQAAPGLRGSRLRVVADATAKIFCPVTCGVC